MKDMTFSLVVVLVRVLFLAVAGLSAHELLLAAPFLGVVVVAAVPPALEPERKNS